MRNPFLYFILLISVCVGGEVISASNNDKDKKLLKRESASERISESKRNFQDDDKYQKNMIGVLIFSDNKYQLEEDKTGNITYLAEDHITKKSIYGFERLLQKKIGKKIELRGVLNPETKEIKRLISLSDVSPNKLKNKTVLMGIESSISSTGVRLGKDGLNHFKRTGLTLSWLIDVPGNAEYTIDVIVSSKYGGAQYSIGYLDQKLTATIPKTGALKKDVQVKVGKLNLKQGIEEIRFIADTMSPLEQYKGGYGFMSLVLDLCD